MWFDLQLCSQCIARENYLHPWGNNASCFEYTRCRELRGGSCLYFISSPCVSRYGAYLVWRLTSRVHLDPHYSITRVWVGRQMFALVDLGTVEPASHVYPHPPPPPSSPLIYKSHWATNTYARVCNCKIQIEPFDILLLLWTLACIDPASFCWCLWML